MNHVSINVIKLEKDIARKDGRIVDDQNMFYPLSLSEVYDYIQSVIPTDIHLLEFLQVDENQRKRGRGFHALQQLFINEYMYKGLMMVVCAPLIPFTNPEYQKTKEKLISFYIKNGFVTLPLNILSIQIDCDATLLYYPHNEQGKILYNHLVNAVEIMNETLTMLSEKKPEMSLYLNRMDKCANIIGKYTKNISFQHTMPIVNSDF